ncbi:DUF4190 domain-containing protein [Psychromicrobium xiongbiense]|uniref:DUF4190 domain-containing protein n=1 Tax=Psychromicrobium xiongbiense TaxID=3051184 RepID=UPI002553C350|nr:DUF4190 domain-containing protein [Psychromicrobium sp. YIM S02556]
MSDNQTSNYPPASPAGSYAAPAEDPGKTMGIIAIVLPFVGFGLIGMILGFVARSKSKKAGFKNTPALVAIILGLISVVVTTILLIIGIVAAVTLGQTCAQLGPGVHNQGGVQITCGSNY